MERDRKQKHKSKQSRKGDERKKRKGGGYDFYRIHGGQSQKTVFFITVYTTILLYKAN
jgi:uncharacterized FlgJ-related protein